MRLSYKPLASQMRPERFKKEDDALKDSLTLGCIWKVPLKCSALCVGTGDAGKGERQGGASDSQGERR